ncbi:hypothetical protein [Streptomyces spirodelae]|uniref:Uncharacterized protein n=1 Tax=Streptomyces spirodelae TaxID=2812904 RepID=A0ABS3X1M0_9ACTN|nr:hypothetical protein [Streptomyces spirodelae]MBO8189219.1 hypothetical protein [Streptomyces spirodelae]
MTGPLTIGSRVRYHGSHQQLHGREFTLLACHGDCPGCQDQDPDEEAPGRYFRLEDPDSGQGLAHVRAASITPLPHTWPQDAVAITIGGYHYRASHTEYGGSSGARVVHFHTADGGTGRTFCRLPDGPTPPIRLLDAAARRRTGAPANERTSPTMAITKIPDVINHRALLDALNSIRAEVESRQEDVDNLAAWSGEMAERMRGIAEELQALNVDSYTVGNMAMLGDLIDGQAAAADRYKNATDTSVTQAETAARTAHRNHGRIQDAVDDSDVPMANAPFYSAE